MYVFPVLLRSHVPAARPAPAAAKRNAVDAFPVADTFVRQEWSLGIGIWKRYWVYQGTQDPSLRQVRDVRVAPNRAPVHRAQHPAEEVPRPGGGGGAPRLDAGEGEALELQPHTAPSAPRNDERIAGRAAGAKRRRRRWRWWEGGGPLPGGSGSRGM